MCIYIYIYTCLCTHMNLSLASQSVLNSPASRRGRDKRGRRRGAAIPPNELSRENVGNM